MTGETYKPSMTPTLVPQKGSGEGAAPVFTIRCSHEYVQSIGPELTEREQAILADSVVGQAICPRLYWFADTAETRRLLRVNEKL